MPVTVVVGGQFGSEGKGKVAYCLAQELNAEFVIRCGGPNSGHTVIDKDGNTKIFWQLPTATISEDIKLVICAGSYINMDVLLKEISDNNIKPSRLYIDPNAVIITEELKKTERELMISIGSTGSGTGAAVIARASREVPLLFAKYVPELEPFVEDVPSILRKALYRNVRVIIEGTQGFGLSVLHSGLHPYVTSRDTTAAAFVSEAGLSPMDVDDVVMVLRTFPIRVAGESGPLPNEISWDRVTKEGGHKFIQEITSVTKRVRRVARFHPDVVKAAITINNPTRIVLNHADYVCSDARLRGSVVGRFVYNIECLIDRGIDYLGFDADSITKRWVLDEH